MGFEALRARDGGIAGKGEGHFLATRRSAQPSCSAGRSFDGSVTGCF